MRSDPKLQIWSEDECHFQRAATVVGMWSLKGQQPHIPSDSTKEKISFFGAVNLHTGSFQFREEPTFNAESFGAFLEQLLPTLTESTKAILILDNARFHHAVKLRPLLESCQNKLELWFLPPYSPDLNPTERIWRLTRRNHTHNTYFPDLEALRSTVRECFSSFTEPNQTLLRLCAI